MLYADANVLIRFILKDNAEMAKKAEDAIIAGELFVLPEVFAEIVYVLNSVYDTERKVIAEALSPKSAIHQKNPQKYSRIFADFLQNFS